MKYIIKATDPSVCNHDIHPLLRTVRERLLEHRQLVLPLRDIADHELSIAVELGFDLLAGLLVDVTKDNEGASGNEVADIGLAHAVGTASDDGGLAFDVRSVEVSIAGDGAGFLKWLHDEHEVVAIG